ncbi:hypothetical protein [Catellatospora chokoriensis]|uniref:PH domain-containing protein n=1 Tax=Catellatospora chokoriensis TaxID=310353 RepID=A0A8J3NVC6_9ACTN|nr:hypothetical protein [Catellatospora chokoriensis]GIF92135.1 hypothetical protein Cch02nite_55790 [Catellatospora chokoriensis]
MTIDQPTIRVRSLTPALLGVAVLMQVLATRLPDRPVPWGILLELASLLAAAVFLGLAILRPNGSVARFAMRDGAFVTSSRMWRHMTWFWMFAGGSLVTGSLLDGAAEGTDWLDAALGMPVLLVVLLYLVLTALDLPRLELTPEGIRLAHLRTTTVPWAALRPGTPLRPHPNARTLQLISELPELLPQHLRDSRMIDLGWDVHPWLLADAIRWYVDHPGHRASIGTQAELDRLHAAV